MQAGMHARTHAGMVLKKLLRAHFLREHLIHKLQASKESLGLMWAFETSLPSPVTNPQQGHTPNPS